MGMETPSSFSSLLIFSARLAYLIITSPGTHSNQMAAKQGAREVAESLLSWYTELHDAAVLDAGQ